MKGETGNKFKLIEEPERQKEGKGRKRLEERKSKIERKR